MNKPLPHNPRKRKGGGAESIRRHCAGACDQNSASTIPCFGYQRGPDMAHHCRDGNWQSQSTNPTSEAKGYWGLFFVTSTSSIVLT